MDCHLWGHTEPDTTEVILQQQQQPVDKNLPANAGDMGLIPGPGRLHKPQSN